MCQEQADQCRYRHVSMLHQQSDLTLEEQHASTHVPAASQHSNTARHDILSRKSPICLSDPSSVDMQKQSLKPSRAAQQNVS